MGARARSRGRQLERGLRWEEIEQEDLLKVLESELMDEPALENLPLGRVLQLAWEESFPGCSFSVWAPFPPIPATGCDLCPPSKYLAFHKRVGYRALLIGSLTPGIRKLVVKSEKALRLIIWVAMLPGLAMELAFSGQAIMKTYWIAVLLCFVLLVLIVLPVTLDQLGGVAFAGTTSILFNVLLTGVSVVFSYVLAKPIADRQARWQWLPFAEDACNNVTTVACTAERMRRQQLARCQMLQERLPPGRRSGAQGVTGACGFAV